MGIENAQREIDPMEKPLPLVVILLIPIYVMGINPCSSWCPVACGTDPF
ncbi:MAG: hypothetical protein Q7J07_02770 [Pelolinea sp.]|nr:hypothetical protein [Pelolinea sp.]